MVNTLFKLCLVLSAGYGSQAHWGTQSPTQQPIGNYSTNCVAQFSSGKGAISSPFYPEQYPNHATCLWIFKSEPGLNISLNFRKFNTRKDIDTVEIYDGTFDQDQQLAKLSGSNLPASQLSFLTQNTVLSMVFLSSESPEAPGSGFIADYYLGCQDQLFTSKKGGFSSPNFPGPYPKSAICLYFINVPAPSGYAVSIKFPTFDLSYNDEVIFYNGISTDYYRQFLRVSGREPLSSLLAPSNQVTMQLRPENWGESYGKGFEASYELICGGGFYIPDYYYRPDSQIITSANYPQNYGNNLDCHYSITARDGYVVAVFFKDFNTEQNEDFVSIFDGEDTDSPLIAKLSGSPPLQGYMSTGKHMLIKFTSNSKTNHRGFKLVYKQFDLQRQQLPYSGDVTTQGYDWYSTEIYYDYDVVKESIN